MFFDATADGEGEASKGLPDGLKVDGRATSSPPGRAACSCSRRTASTSARIVTGDKNGNCGWGDDGSTLYIMADMYLCRVRTKTRGATWK